MEDVDCIVFALYNCGLTVVFIKETFDLIVARLSRLDLRN